MLKQQNIHGSKEILCVMSSLTTCDPGDIFQTVDELTSLSIRADIISLSAEVYIYKEICSRTKGIIIFLKSRYV